MAEKEANDDGRDRSKTAGESPLNPLSLAGSWFHGDNAVGLVVGEVQPGVYMCEFYDFEPVEVHDWMLGPAKYQQLVTLDHMAGWKFYDSVAWLRESFQKDRKEIGTS